MSSVDDLRELRGSLDSLSDISSRSDVEETQANLGDAVSSIDRSFGGSSLGYHASVYYRNFIAKPPGAHFSQEWGLKDMSLTSLGSSGDWVEYDSDDVTEHLFLISGDPDKRKFGVLCDAIEECENQYEELHADAVSILQLEQREDDFFLRDQLKKIEKITPTDEQKIINDWFPRGQVMTRDTIALGQGWQVPPHWPAKATIERGRHVFACVAELSKQLNKVISHLERRKRIETREERVGSSVFVGHGRSTVWRDLKDFLQDRLSLPWDEFNRVPVAGVTNIARLSEMMDSAAIAFIVMTAEDEQIDGKMQARMNVIHEAGLFQGRLGFSRAILLVEEGCEEFSNVEGLGQIRFPKGNIAAKFEDVRLVLEREGLVE